MLSSSLFFPLSQHLRRFILYSLEICDDGVSQKKKKKEGGRGGAVSLTHPPRRQLWLIPSD